MEFGLFFRVSPRKNNKEPNGTIFSLFFPVIHAHAKSALFKPLAFELLDKFRRNCLRILLVCS